MPAAYVRPWSQYTNTKRFFKQDVIYSVTARSDLPEVQNSQVSPGEDLSCHKQPTITIPDAAQGTAPPCSSERKSCLPAWSSTTIRYVHHSCYGCNGSNGSHLELLHILTYFDILLNIHSKIRAKSRDITMPSSIFKHSSKCNVLHTIILNIVVQDIYTCTMH